MNQEKILAELDKLIKGASQAEVIAFIEKLAKERPELGALLLNKLKNPQK
jgi:hypothetical protein